jgi:hypothetical protein
MTSGKSKKVSWKASEDRKRDLLRKEFFFLRYRSGQKKVRPPEKKQEVTDDPR